MSRPSGGARKTSQPLTLRQHFLRSNTTTTLSSPNGIEVSLPGSPHSDTSERSTPERTLKKKASFWNIFSRGSRKVSSSSTASAQDRDISLPLSKAISVAQTTSTEHASAIAFERPISSSASSFSMNLYAAASTSSPSTMVLRSQKSMHTLRSPPSIPTLRTARSHYTLRRPSGLPFDSDSVFSNDSDDVSVSWITSTGRRKVGIDDDDQDLLDIRS